MPPRPHPQNMGLHSRHALRPRSRDRRLHSPNLHARGSLSSDPVLAVRIPSFSFSIHRIFLISDIGGPRSNSAFLILSPAFLAASIYLCFGRIVSIYSTPLSPLSPRRILLLFVLCDIINLVLQGAGGALSSTSLTPNGIQAGLQVILAGLVTQVVSLLLFLVLCADFARRVRRGGRKLRKDTWELRQMGVWKAFLAGIVLLRHPEFHPLKQALMLIFIQGLQHQPSQSSSAPFSASQS